MMCWGWVGGLMVAIFMPIHCKHISMYNTNSVLAYFSVLKRVSALACVSAVYVGAFPVLEVSL